MFFRASFLLLLVSLWGCATLYKPTEQDAANQKLALSKLIEGRDLYLNHCGGCHNLFLPNQYTAVEWCEIMDRMTNPAQIDQSQTELILNYLKSGAKRTQP